MAFPELWVLFTTSFLSATILPGGSEANFLYLLKTSTHSLESLIAVATLGNTLGGLTNYGLGALASHGIRFQFLEKQDRQAALARVRRYGPMVLLLAWLPVIGDPLCLAAGYLRTRWWESVLFMGMGKCMRYTVLAWMGMGIL